MTTKHYFVAIHSTGAKHLRTSNGHGNYHWAVVRSRTAGGASFSSRLDLAQREAEKQRRWHSDVEVVPAHEIEKADYNRLLKASKAAYAVTFRGKKFSKTTSIESKPLTHAVGMYRAAGEVRVDIDPTWTKWLEQYPEGFYMQQRREEFLVVWFTSGEEAQRRADERASQGYTVELFSL